MYVEVEGKKHRKTNEKEWVKQDWIGERPNASGDDDYDCCYYVVVAAATASRARVVLVTGLGGRRRGPGELRVEHSPRRRQARGPGHVVAAVVVGGEV